MKATSNPTADDFSKNENRPFQKDAKTTAQPRKSSISRRSFLGKSLAMGAGTIGVGLLGSARAAEESLSLTSGDAALLRFPAALELIEADFWIQYNELGGIQDSEVPGGTGNPDYTEALAALDEDMDQYIHDNTDDEITHHTFLNAYLMSKGAAPANLDPFRTLMGSTATGVNSNRSEEHTSELQSRFDLVCRLLLEKKKITRRIINTPSEKQLRTRRHYALILATCSV